MIAILPQPDRRPVLHWGTHLHGHIVFDIGVVRVFTQCRTAWVFGQRVEAFWRGWESWTWMLKFQLFLWCISLNYSKPLHLFETVSVLDAFISEHFSLDKFLRLLIVYLTGLSLVDLVYWAIGVVIDSETLAFHVNITAQQIIQMVSLLQEWYELFLFNHWFGKVAWLVRDAFLAKRIRTCLDKLRPFQTRLIWLFFSRSILADDDMQARQWRVTSRWSLFTRLVILATKRPSCLFQTCSWLVGSGVWKAAYVATVLNVVIRLLLLHVWVVVLTL